jgi:preprotein translocase subunit SecD
MNKLKKIFTNIRVIILLVFVLLAVVAIHPNPYQKGVAIRNVALNSSASIAGIESANPNIRPMARERIIAINNKFVNNLKDYYDIVNQLKVNKTITIKTNKGLYRLVTQPKKEVIELNETEVKVIVEEVFNEILNKTVNVTKEITVPKTKTIIYDEVDLGLNVYDAPKTNIKKGLDLQGGTRVLLQPEEKVSKDYISELITNMEQRLNVFGLSDVILREASDLSGNQYILVEIAGTNEEEVKELLAKQGKFEAKIGNETVFKGGKDITYVCRSADCSGIDPTSGCGLSGSQWFCRFRFAITLNPKAAEKQAELTKDLEVITTDNQEYLSKKLELFLDNKKVDELNIGADLKGRAVTDIEISGSGLGTTRQEAVFNSLENMKRLQTILITGSLPVKLNIVRTDTISPLLGEEFINNALLIGVLAIITISLVIFLRYKKWEVSVPIIFNSIFEVVIILGVAALIGWNLDLAAIAGIIIAVGTGVDNLIVIADETLRGELSQVYDWKKRIKSAFFIIMASYFTTIVAMTPLLFAGAGLLKGFAITTMIGISAGVFLTRPAYAAVVEILLRD